MGNFFLSEKSLKNIEGVDSRLIEITKLAITITKVDYGHGQDSGLRTAERQRELFNDRLSKADGFEKQSKHQTGRALDVYAYVDGKASWEPEHLAMVAAAMLQAANRIGIKLEWGGLWSTFQDMPHFQLVD